MADDYSLRDHQAWLGYLQPDGLVVSPAALVDSQVILARDVREEQQQFLEFVAEIQNGDDSVAAITELPALLQGFLGWPAELLHGGPERPVPESLSIPIAESETLTPTAALADAKPQDPQQPWLLLIQDLPLGTDLDAVIAQDSRSWAASPSRRFERLLREAKIPIGLLANGVQLRLVYAPRGENAGTLTFRVRDMLEVAGRPILGAFHMLLKRSRLLAGPAHERLPAILARSREYQSRVSTQLAGQVLDALYELLRGFQAADERSGGLLLAEVLQANPNAVYAGLLNTLLRLVFLLYAEDRGLMPGSALYGQNYSVHGLFEKLRADHERYPDTLDSRYGAWARLIALFKAVHGGCRHPQMAMPPRAGYLFDPTRFPFLEGVPKQALRHLAGEDAGAPGKLPLVADGVIWRVLSKLLMLDGERLSYRTLDVEQIGSVYETMMGFRLELTAGPSIALKPASAKKLAAPTVVNLADLLAVKAGERDRWLKENFDQKIDGAAGAAMKKAASLDDLLAALDKRIARNATPHPVPAGGMVLQPSDERRRSGSHYTPRSLTAPIVERTLAPVLARLGENPSPAQILDLKVCDPAAGSGAFLVEACRQLGDALVNAWQAHHEVPPIPPDEDEVLHARRLVAQRCLYGVDRNTMAADLAKLSLWLATLAKDHPFTFLDHTLRSGDSLVGLSRRQIEDFHWRACPSRAFGQMVIEERLRGATAARREILDAGDDLPPEEKADRLKQADEALYPVRLAGDAVVAAFFAADKYKAREVKRDAWLAAYNETLETGLPNEVDAAVDELRGESVGAAPRGDWACGETQPHRLAEANRREARLPQLRGNPAIHPFHWPIEFPEVFQRQNPGFDAFIGNPPFAGKNTLINGNRAGYLDWLKVLHAESHGNADLVAHFFRRAFDLLRQDGTFGLIATNTIGQGDTRSTGLRWICTHGGGIYWARKRYKWPGAAAVVVSVVHVHKTDSVFKTESVCNVELDGRRVEKITAYLFHAGGHDDPKPLKANAGKSFQGSIVLGMGFTFDDTDNKGVASPLAEMRRLIEQNPKNAERIFPYIGGEEVNDSPTHAHHRYVINFADFPLRREDLGETWAGAEDKQRETWLRTGIVPLDYPGPVAADWPDLLEIVERKVKPGRDTDNREIRKRYWWRFGETTPALFAAIDGLKRVLVISRVGQHGAFTFKTSGSVFSESMVIFPLPMYSAFSFIQSRIHETWARFFASSMKDDMRYSPSDCFETFPFPSNQEYNPVLESTGQTYYDFRAELMVKNNEGLTKTYNRFHDPDETSPDILRLRELHTAMDRAVLDAYGWADIPTDCVFLLDWEDDEADEETLSPGQPPALRASPAGRVGKRKKPWRYRWPDDIRDEVLARLLALNAERAAEEENAGKLAAETVKPAKTQRKAGKSKPDDKNFTLEF